MKTAKKLMYFNLSCTVVWLLLGIPSLIWWKDSILWVIIISLWANIVGHFSAYISSRGEVAQTEGHNLTKADKEWMNRRTNE